MTVGATPLLPYHMDAQVSHSNDPPQAGADLSRNSRSERRRRWAWRGALEDGQLAPQREVLEHEGAAGSQHAEEACDDEGGHAGHHRSNRPTVQR